VRFEFATATRIIFAPGASGEAGSLAADMGKRPLVLHDGAKERSAPLLNILSNAGLETSEFPVTGEPTIPGVLSATEKARQAGCDMVVGIGGGSVVDAGKAVAALLTNGGEPLDYLEVIGRGRPIEKPSAPYVAIPTTAGTGAEVTKNSVLLSPEHKVKVSMRSPLMLPRVALVDPLLTHSMPPAVTASTGLDALTQLLEPFVSKKANPVTDGICREGLALAARSLRRAYEDGTDAEARADMTLASLFGGLALANAGLGAAHGFAGPLGGMFPAPHGAVCARLLPYVVETNVRALQERAPDSPVLERFAEVARVLTADPTADIQDGVKWIQDLCADLKVPPLSEYGVGEKDFVAVVEKAQRASSMKGNPVELSVGELTEVLRKATQ
jgi:alcohol dehydrogenase class IV